MIFNPFKQEDFCYFYSLQAGMLIAQSITFFLMMAIIIVNLCAANPEISETTIIIQYFLVYIFASLGILVSLFGITASYNESENLTITCVILQVIHFIYWVVLMSLSFTNNPNFTRSICIDNRCPDHLWLQDAVWRTYPKYCDPEDSKLPVEYNNGDGPFGIAHNNTSTTKPNNITDETSNEPTNKNATKPENDAVNDEPIQPEEVANYVPFQSARGAVIDVLFQPVKNTYNDERNEKHSSTTSHKHFVGSIILAIMIASE